jgi:hypothetical protein
MKATKTKATKTEAINIGPREQSKRRVMGIVALTVGVSLAFLLVVLQAPRLARLVVFFPVWIAGLGLLQSREKT